MPIKLDAFDNKKWTVVVDFYKLNTKILQGYYPLPNIEEILNLLSRARYFSTFDLASGFLQIPVHFEFKKMPIEIRNAPMIDLSARNRQNSSRNSRNHTLPALCPQSQRNITTDLER